MEGICKPYLRPVSGREGVISQRFSSESSLLSPDHKKVIKVSSYIAQYPGLWIAQSAFTLYFPDRLVQSNTVSTSLGSIQPYVIINARRMLVPISNTVYSQVLNYTVD